MRNEGVRGGRGEKEKKSRETQLKLIATPWLSK
jgi:hypothetical protein